MAVAIKSAVLGENSHRSLPEYAELSNELFIN